MLLPLSLHFCSRQQPDLLVSPVFVDFDAPHEVFCIRGLVWYLCNAFGLIQCDIFDRIADALSAFAKHVKTRDFAPFWYFGGTRFKTRNNGGPFFGMWVILVSQMVKRCTWRLQTLNWKNFGRSTFTIVWGCITPMKNFEWSGITYSTGGWYFESIGSCSWNNKGEKWGQDPI